MKSIFLWLQRLEQFSGICRWPLGKPLKKHEVQEPLDAVLFCCCIGATLVLFGSFGDVEKQRKKVVADAVFPPLKNTHSADVSTRQLLCHDFCLQVQSAVALRVNSPKMVSSFHYTVGISERKGAAP